jgi:hypothetical protein
MITNNEIATIYIYNIYMVKIDIGKLKGLDVLKSRPKLTASDGDVDDYFGTSVAFSNNGLLAIGAYNDDDNAQSDSGSVYLFSGSGTNWTEIKKITASDAAATDYFGYSLAFSNNGLLAIGALLGDVTGNDNKGSVYLFSGSGTNWTQQTKLNASDAATDDNFGSSVAFSNNGLLAVGTIYDDDNDDGNRTGSVYLFSGSGTNWTQQTKLTAYDAASGDFFGRSVAFNKNGLLAIGANVDDGNGLSASGSVYLYDLPLVKNKTKKKSLIQLSDSEVINYMEEDEYNGITILGIVKTENANGDKINYLILDNDPNNVYGQLLKIKNDNTISRTEKIAIYKNYQDIYKNSPEIYNYIESLLKN